MVTDGGTGLWSHPPPFAIPGNVLEMLQSGWNLGNREDSLYVQAVMLTQVRKSMCDQKNITGLSPILGNPHSQSRAHIYPTLQEAASFILGLDFNTYEQVAGS